MLTVAKSFEFIFWTSTGWMLFSFIFILLSAFTLVWMSKVRKLAKGLSRQFLGTPIHKTTHVLTRLDDKLKSQELLMRQMVEEMEKIGDNDSDQIAAAIDGPMGKAVHALRNKLSS